jgi:Uma2 family endonuclease
MTTLTSGGKKLLDRADFHDLVHRGVLADADRVELIEGEVVGMAAVGHRHGGHVARITDFLLSRLRGRVVLWLQSSVALSDVTELQPDVALVHYREDYYVGADDVPWPREIFLVIEVADSSLRFDRGRKARLYAAAGVPELWIANLRKEILEVYREPGPHGYSRVSTLRRGDPVAVAAFPDVVFDVADLLGPKPARQ